MAICNTVMVDTNIAAVRDLNESSIRYHATSPYVLASHSAPHSNRTNGALFSITLNLSATAGHTHHFYRDEEALVLAAARFGFELRSRVGDKIVVAILGVEYVYEVLFTIEFNSYRKRCVSLALA